ncbi:MAG: DNA-binding protein [Phycisphaerae bacterium]|nr:MAG: DNA-binding protein [Phycisphaerae bacterium]
MRATLRPDSVMTIDELSSYLKVPKSTLYKLAQEGKVPGQKVGRHWRFHRVVIDDWLRHGEAKGSRRRRKTR